MNGLVFTRNGKRLKRTFKAPVGANDIHVVWRGKGGLVVVIFTRDGKPLAAQLAPAEANDVEFRWSDYGFTKAFWTRNGKYLKTLPVPRKANDVHVFVLGGNGTIVKVFWTKNGRPIGDPVPVPKGANDLHVA